MIWRVFVGTLRQVRLVDWIVLVGLVAMAADHVQSAIGAAFAFWAGASAGAEALYRWIREENDAGHD